MPDSQLIRRIALETAQKMAGAVSTMSAEEWFDMADDLERAARIARAEGNRLSRLKGDR